MHGNRVANAQLNKAFIILEWDFKHSDSTRKCQVHPNLTLELLSKMRLDKSRRNMIVFTKSKICGCTALNYFGVFRQCLRSRYRIVLSCNQVSSK